MKGLVLEGGGVKGAYQVGAVKALFEHGYKFDGYVGTSIGAINSAMLVQGDWDKLINMWENMLASKILDVESDDFLRAFKGQFDKAVITELGKIISNLGEFIDKSTNNSRAFLKQYIDEDAIRKSPYDFGLVTYCISDFQAHYYMKEDIPEGEICDYVIASANYPVFRTQQLAGFEGKRFIDGGIYDNMPINLLAKKGYKDIIVIRTTTRHYRRKLLSDDLNISYIVPSEKMSTAMDFTEENIIQYMKMGYYDAKRWILNLTSYRYCVETLNYRDFMDFMNKIPAVVYKNILTALNKNIHRANDANIEDICEIIRINLDLDRETSDFTAFTNFLEIYATVFNVDRYKIYNLPELFDKVMAAANFKCQDYSDIVELLKSEKSIKPELKLIFIELFNSYNFV